MISDVEAVIIEAKNEAILRKWTTDSAVTHYLLAALVAEIRRVSDLLQSQGEQT